MGKTRVFKQEYLNRIDVMTEKKKIVQTFRNKAFIRRKSQQFKAILVARYCCCKNSSLLNKQKNRFSSNIHVSLRLRVQNGVSRLISALCVNCLISIPCTMRKLSECYSGIFQTQSSGCVSGLDHFRNFTNLKILNI